MGSLIYYAVLFLAKVLDNALSTTKTILIQRSRWLLAGIAVVLSDFIYFWLTKRIVFPLSAILFIFLMHFFWKRVSPTARTSSTSRISGSK